jgi:hypothetical protein
LNRLLAAGAAALLLLTVPGLSESAPAKKQNQSRKTDKVGQALNAVHTKHMARDTKKARGPADQLVLARTTRDGFVAVDVVAAGTTSALASKLRSLGARNVSEYGRALSRRACRSRGSLTCSPARRCISPYRRWQPPMWVW